MSARRFRLLGAFVHRPDERGIPEADRVGHSIAVPVVSLHLKGLPVDHVRLTEHEAVRLASTLLLAVQSLKGVTP